MHRSESVSNPTFSLEFINNIFWGGSQSRFPSYMPFLISGKLKYLVDPPHEQFHGLERPNKTKCSPSERAGFHLPLIWIIIFSSQLINSRISSGRRASHNTYITNSSNLCILALAAIEMYCSAISVKTIPERTIVGTTQINGT